VVRKDDEHMRTLRNRQVSLGVVVWVVLGLIVAAREGFLDDLGSLERILSAILAVAVWPLVLLDVHFGI
jgi:hypothetical protein